MPSESALEQENARLRTENTQLKSKVATLTKSGGDIGTTAAERELKLHKQGLRGDETVDEHDELLALRRRCRVYERALDETEENLRQLKALYGQLQ